MATVLIAIGSNLGDRQETLSGALAELDRRGGLHVVARSGLYETVPVGGPSGQESFLNAVVRLETSVPAAALLDQLHSIESKFGRQRAEHWAARSLDLDLLLYDHLVLNTPQLVVPHPRMEFRRFVLEPAAEVAPHMMHPVIGWTIAQLRDHVRSPVDYVAIIGPPGVGKTRLATQAIDRLTRGFGIRARFVEGPRPADVLANLPNEPAGHTPPAEIEFLRARRRVLAASVGATSEQWIFTDFWLDQSLAYASTYCSDDRLSDLRTALQETRIGVPDAKLLVAVRGQSVISEETPNSHDQPWGRAHGQAVDARLEAALTDLAREKGRGPTLFIGDTTYSRRVDELAAAVAAMHYQPRRI